MSDLEAIKAHLGYVPATGALLWVRPTSRRHRAGAAAGNLDSQGYVRICLKGKIYAGHRLAWCLFHGSWPEMDIDHINRDRADNRIENLRLVTKSQNQFNRSKAKHNTSGVKGVGFCKIHQKYRAKIRANKREYSVGYFDTIEDAHRAYVAACQALHGEYGRPE